jgi:hypothetical protein
MAWLARAGRRFDPESLSLGSTIVTTTETGLARWLTENWHFVVESQGSEIGFAAALERALLNPIDPATVQATLPAEDGRVVADRWLHQVWAPGEN